MKIRFASDLHLPFLGRWRSSVQQPVTNTKRGTVLWAVPSSPGEPAWGGGGSQPNLFHVNSKKRICSANSEH